MTLSARRLVLNCGRSLQLLYSNNTTGSAVGNVLYFHGWPSSAAEANFIHKSASEAGLNLACFSRPGIGASTSDTRISFQTVADDARQVLEHLGWDKNVILAGTSGGGPYAAACASILTNDPKYSRVRPAIKGLVLIASMTHTCGPDSAQLLAGMDMGNRIGYNMINFLPTITKHAIHVGAAAFKYMAMPTSRILMPRSFRSDTNKPLARCENLKQEHEEGLQTSQFNSSVRIGTPSWLKRMAFKMATTGMPQSDRDALKQSGPGVGFGIMHMLSDVFGGPGLGQGLWQDMRLTSQPWNVNLTDIQTPTLIFQGDADVNVTIGMAEYLGKLIPGVNHPAAKAARSFLLQQHGHDINTKPGPASLADCSQTHQIQRSDLTNDDEYLNNNDKVCYTDATCPGVVLYRRAGHLTMVLSHSKDIMACAARLLD